MSSLCTFPMAHLGKSGSGRRSGRPFTLMMLRIITGQVEIRCASRVPVQCSAEASKFKTALPGRTHQIRVHIAELGLAAGLETAGIAGDASVLDQLPVESRCCYVSYFCMAPVIQVIPITEAKYLDSAAFAGDVALFQRASQGLAKAAWDQNGW